MKPHPLLAVLLAGALFGCAEAPSASGPGPAPSGSATAPLGSAGLVLARVNGAPITAVDVELKLKNDSHEAVPGPGRMKVVLEQLVTREILAQQAQKDGLDKDPGYLEGLARLEAQVAAYKRQELSELFLRRESEKRSVPTEADARAYFDKNEKRIRAQMHVLQILRRSEAAIMEVRGAIEGGKSFEQAAKDLFPGLPEGQTPWDLGYLSFQQVPEPWRETLYDLKPGEMSGILRGPNERYWLIQLVAVRDDPSVTFESVKEAVLADMKANKLQRSREDIERELRQGARVEMLAEP